MWCKEQLKVLTESQTIKKVKIICEIGSTEQFIHIKTMQYVHVREFLYV